jgi:hypothetical protein
VRIVPLIIKISPGQRLIDILYSNLKNKWFTFRRFIMMLVPRVDVNILIEIRPALGVFQVLVNIALRLAPEFVSDLFVVGLSIFAFFGFAGQVVSLVNALALALVGLVRGIGVLDIRIFITVRIHAVKF